ncbi:MAG TPA: glycosyltransferase family A protein [Dehalococcoidia bacterium]
MIAPPTVVAGHSFIDAIRPEMYAVVAERRVGDASPVATIIVPTRQRAALVRETIEALFAQDFDPPYEVIVVDNASTDEASTVLEHLAAAAPRDFLAVRMHRDEGPATSRNAGAALARAEYVAFTDSDCLPSPGWLRACVGALERGCDVVQGQTLAPPWQRQPLFSHFIETRRADGSFSTSNVAYRRDVVLRAGGFDRTRDYWEDVDLGWRAVSSGARYMFVADALVHHQVIAQSPLEWLRHARRFANWPEKAAHYPSFRRHLFLGVWVDWFHSLVSVAALGLVASKADRRFLLLAAPYAVAFPFRHGLQGRAPLLKAAAHLARDAFSFAALLGGSIRHRSVVL